MGKTQITPQLLLQKGFDEKMMFGQTIYVKGKYALVHSFAWVPCNLEFGTPLSTNMYVNTWEEFEKLTLEGGEI